MQARRTGTQVSTWDKRVKPEGSVLFWAVIDVRLKRAAYKRLENCKE